MRPSPYSDRHHALLLAQDPHDRCRARAARARHADAAPRPPRSARNADRAALPRRARAHGRRHGLLLGRRAHLLAGRGRVHDRRRATRAASRRTRATRRSAPPAPVTPRSCSRSSTRTVTSYEAMLRLFWEGHDPTQGMRQGNDVGTQYRSGLYWTTEAQRTAALASRETYQQQLTAGGPRRDLDRDRRGGAVLLRRAVPPAVPRQEPERVLRDRRHRRQLPDRPARVAFA